MKCVDRAIGWIVKNWDRIPDADHPSSADLLVVAHIINSTCKTTIADYNLDLDESRQIVTVVGNYMFDHLRIRARGGEVLIRLRPAVQLREEMQTVSELLTDQILSIGTADSALLKALFLTGSFFTMTRFLASYT